MTYNKASASLDLRKVIRLVVSAVIFAVALILSDNLTIIKLLLLLLSACVAVYDVVLKAVDCVESKEFFAAPVVLTFVAFVSIVIGFASFKVAVDGTAMCIIYFAGTLVIDYATFGTESTIKDIRRYQSPELNKKVEDIFNKDGALNTETEAVMYESSSRVLRFTLIFAAAFALLVPVLTSFMRFSESIHRALMIVFVCTPTSIVIAMKFISKMAVSYAASQGVVFESAQKMEEASSVDTVVVDKQGVYTSGTPKLVSVTSSIIDKDTFMNFVSHAAYYSEQPFAKAISAVYDKEYRLDVISDFKDIAGMGVELDIASSHVVFGTSALIASLGMAVPDVNADEKNTSVYYLVISDKYIGYALISTDINSEAFSLVEGLKEAGIKKCVLLTEEGKDESEDFGASLDYDNVYGECDIERKKQIVEKYESYSQHGSAYVYANSMEDHSPAKVDIRVGRKTRFADAVVSPDFVSSLAEVFTTCKRMRELSVIVAVSAFVIKALLIFLSIIGSASLWFVALIDMVVSAGTIILSVRVTKESPIAAFIYKYGREK